MANVTSTLIIALSLLAPSLVVLRRLFYKPLHDIKGPFLARFSRIWYFFSVLGGKHEKEAVALHRKHGKIVRLTPNEYSIDDPQAMKMIYGPGTHFTKAEWYKGFDLPGKPSIFSGRDNQAHARDRKKLQKYYSTKVMTSYEGFVDNCTSLLSRKFHELAKTEQSIDLSWWLQCFAFDVIGEITYSRRFGFLDDGHDQEGLVHSVQANSKYGTLVGIFPEFHYALFLINDFLARLGLCSNLAGVRVRNWTLERWSKRRSEMAEKAQVGGEGGGVAASDDDAVGAPKDFMTKFVEVNEKDPEEFDIQDVMNGVGANIFAGSDTTSIVLSAIFYHLNRNPDTLRKLRAEISQHEKDGKVSNPITFQETQGLEYLQAVIKEALRVNPPLGLTLPRKVPAGGATISDHYFPQGTVVGINAWIAHFNTDVYGPDAASFKPERWLKSCNDEATLSRMERYYFPFGAGSRVCLGRNVSMLEITKLVPEIVKRFDFEFSEELLREGVETENIFFMVPRNMFAKVRERKEDEG